MPFEDDESDQPNEITSNATISDLPIEIFSLIIKNLDILDLANCRLVSKKWRNCVDQANFKPVELIIEHGIDSVDWIETSYKWYDSKSEINLRNKIKKLDSFSFGLDKLKRIYFLNEINLSKFDLNSLIYRLPHLECLQLHSLSCDQLSSNKIFNLILPPTLKILQIPFLIFIEKLLIDSPNLKVLYTSHLDRILLIYPGSVKQYETFSLPFNSPSVLKRFPNLKSIKFNRSQNQSCLFLDIAMNDLIEQRSKLSKEHVKIFFHGTQLIGKKRFEDYNL